MKKGHERLSIGVLRCASKDDEVVEYALARTTSPTLVAEYLAMRMTTSLGRLYRSRPWVQRAEVDAGRGLRRSVRATTRGLAIGKAS